MQGDLRERIGITLRERIKIKILKKRMRNSNAEGPKGKDQKAANNMGGVFK